MNLNYFERNDSIFDLIAQKEFRHPTLSRLEEVERLSDGWHFGKGYAFHKDVVDAAKKVFENVSREMVSDTEVFPGINGDISLLLYIKEHTYEFNIRLTGGINVTHEVDDVERDKKVISVNQIREEVLRIKDEQTPTFSDLPVLM